MIAANLGAAHGAKPANIIKNLGKPPVKTGQVSQPAAADTLALQAADISAALVH